MALISCIECGAQISDKAANCIKCGAPVVKKETFKCFECNTELEKGTKVCSNCGAEQDAKPEIKEHPTIQEKPKTAQKAVTEEAKPIQQSAKKKSKKIVWFIIGGIVLIVAVLMGISSIRQSAIQEGKYTRDTEIQNQQNYEQAEQERQQAIENIQAQLSDEKALLEVEKSRLDKIKGFRLGRLPSEKDQQIFDQTKVIEQVEERIKNLKQELSQYQ